MLLPTIVAAGAQKFHRLSGFPCAAPEQIQQGEIERWIRTGADTQLIGGKNPRRGIFRQLLGL